MNNVDPTYRAIIDNLRDMGHYQPPPIVPPQTGGDRSEPVKADWEPRVTRLEAGFCVAFVLTFSAIITSHLLLSGKIDTTNAAIQTSAISQVRSEAALQEIGRKLDDVTAAKKQ